MAHTSEDRPIDLAYAYSSTSLFCRMGSIHRHYSRKGRSPVLFTYALSPFLRRHSDPEILFNFTSDFIARHLTSKLLPLSSSSCLNIHVMENRFRGRFCLVDECRHARVLEERKGKTNWKNRRRERRGCLSDVLHVFFP